MAETLGRLRRLRQNVADAAETVFGPDPGLLRLRSAGRTVFSAGITLFTLLLLDGGGGLQAAAPIALGFMTSIFSNMAVREPRPLQQGVTLALLGVPALAAIALASFLSRWPWLADLAFILVVTGATLARMVGPRGMAMGMVGFIAYFIGMIVHPALAQVQPLAVAIVIGIAVSAMMRFALLPDDPRDALHQMRSHLDRRIARILTEVGEVVGNSAPLGSEQSDRERRRLRAEIVRMEDALLIAEGQMSQLEEGDETGSERTAGALFTLQLAVERLARMAAHGPPPREPERMQQRIRELRTLLTGGAARPVRGHLPPVPGTLERALIDLEEALTSLPEELQHDPGAERLDRHAQRRL